MDNDPYGFKKAAEFYSTEEGKKVLDKVVKESIRKSEQRSKARVCTVEQMEQVFDI